MSRKKMRELEDQKDFLAREVVAQRDRIISLRCEIDRANMGKERAEKALVTAEKGA